MSIEQKLDRIIELLEKLVPKSVVLNSPISINSKEDIDINKHLYEISTRVEERKSSPNKVSPNEFVNRVKEVDWDKILRPNISINKKPVDTVEGKWDGVLKIILLE